MATMTGRERVLKALAGERVDQIPWVPFCGVHSGSLINMNAEELLKSAEAVVEAQSRAIEEYKADGIPVVFDLQLEAELLGCELKWATDNPPAVVTHPLESGGASIDDFTLPSATDGRLPVAIEATRQLRARYPDVALYGLICGPFTLALHLLGTNVFMDMFDKPAYVKKVLDFCARYAMRIADYYSDAGCDVIAVVDPMTSQIGPDQFREFCTRPVTQIFDHVRELGRKSSFFVCGHAQQNIEVMCECRCDNISIDENIPLDYVRDICRAKKISFGGNLQLTVVLLTGSEDDSRRNAIECMEIGGLEGFVLSPGCDIPYATPPRNLKAVAEVAHDEYARQVARELARTRVDTAAAYDLSEYGSGDVVVVDIITLDSEGCAPCQYMVESVKQIAPEFVGLVVWREHKIKYRESIAFMSSLMVRNIPTICIDGQIAFVSRIPPREELIKAIQKRINEKLKTRLSSQSNMIRVFGAPDAQCLQVRENVKQAIKELGVDVGYEEIENAAACRQLGVYTTPAVAIVRQIVKSAGKEPSVPVIKEWLKQLNE